MVAATFLNFSDIEVTSGYLESETSRKQLSMDQNVHYSFPCTTSNGIYGKYQNYQLICVMASIYIAPGGHSIPTHNISFLLSFEVHCERESFSDNNDRKRFIFESRTEIDQR